MTEDLKQLTAWDRAHVWHPFTPHSVYGDEDPLMIVAAERHTLINADGRRLLDGVSSLWCNLIGHRRPEIDAAVKAQLDKVAHSTFLGNASAPAVRLARRLVELAPEPLSRVFFSDNGSTAVEAALKMAFQYHQQNGAEERGVFLTLGNAYHGDTIGSVSVGGIALFHQVYGKLLFDTITAPTPDDLIALAAEHGDRLAAIVIEPGLQGAAGMLTQPAGFLRRVREAADRAGTFLIFDEVAVGMGRTGAMFCCQTEGVAPDFLCLAKGLTGGYVPLAATLTTERVFEGFLGPPEAGRTFFHGHTYTGNQLGAAAALATLDVLEREQIVEQVPGKARLLASKLARLRARPGVVDIRQLGLMAGVELAPGPARTGVKVCLAARKHGVFLRPLGDVIVLVPPLTITESELETLVHAIDCGIREVLG